MPRILRVASMADLHYGRNNRQSLHSVYCEIAAAADVLVLCGDLTDLGLPEEAEVALADLRAAPIPIVAVLGNHDYQSGRDREVLAALEKGGVKVLEGDAVEFGGVGFAGAKGFGGGFGARTLEPWGEPTMKRFVKEAVDEALKLESALAKVGTRRRVVLLHYSPIAATVQGEPEQIYPFLGSSRLEDPINRHGCDVVFHGHAHHGTHQGQTQVGIPVYNVSMNLLRRTFPGSPPFRLIEIPID